MPRRKSGHERRRDIALAALRIIGSRGLTAFTTAALAQEVGVTTGALFRHYATLDEVMKEMVRHAVSEMEATFPEPSLPPRQRLFDLARNRVALFRRDPGVSWLLRSEQAYLALPEEAVAALRALVKRSRRYLLEALRQGMAQGSIRNDIEAEVLLVPIMGTVHTLAGMSGVHRSAPSRGGPDPDEVLAALEHMLKPTRPRRRKKNGNES